MSGAAAKRAASSRADGRSARTRRLLPGVLVALLALFVLAIGATSAPAAFRHTTVTGIFGEDGTNGSSWNGRAGAWHRTDSQFYGVLPEHVRIISVPSPGAFTFANPPEGFLVAGGYVGNTAYIDVDNSGGPRDGAFYIVGEGNNSLRGHSADGAALSNFPLPFSGELCGVSVDDDGFVWVGNQEKESVEKYNPQNGALLESVGVSQVGIPCGIEVDENNDDLYVRVEDGPIYKFTKASGYSSFQALTPDTELGSKFTVNADKGILYYIHSDGFIRAHSTATGELIEKVEGLGSVTTMLAVNPDNDYLYAFSGGGSYVFEVAVSEVPKAITEDPAGDSTMKGTVDADGAGAITDCYFEWGTSEFYGETPVPCSPAPPYGPNASVTGLLPGAKETTYHYRVVSENANLGGINRGVDKTITPHHVPFLRTQPATEVTRTSAKLNAAFDGNGKATEYYFEWGPTTAYGTKSHEPPASAGSPVGNTPLDFTASGLTAGQTYHYRIVAVNPDGESSSEDRTFTTLPAVRNVQTDPATDVTPDSATLNGKFEIDNEGGGVTSYHFEYGATDQYGSKTPVVAAGSTPSTPSVSSPVALNPGTTYHYRIVVTNTLGTTVGADQVFKTPQPPSIASFSSSNVTATTADLTATINPNGAATTYRFEYGPTPSYGQVIPIPDGVVGSGEDPIQVSEKITNLEVGATYHFRVVAENEWGEDVSGNQTFSFFTANCPNAYVRQQSGAAYLPDCRAYELVSPGVAGPVQLFPGQGLGPIVNEFIPHPSPSNTGQATSPSRFAYWGGIGQITGTNPPNITQDLYVATRSNDGWETHYPGLSASESLASGGTSCSAAMDRCINFDVADPLESSTEDTGSNGPHVFDANQNSVEVGRFPTMIEDVPGGEEFTGEGLPSADYSHYAFSSNDIPFAPGGLTAAPGSAYDNDVIANTATVISKDSNGDDIVQDPEGCQTDSENTQRYCADEFIRIQAVSTDGSHILLSNWAESSQEFPSKELFVDAFKRRDVHLTMSVSGISYDVTEGHRANYVGMTRNGSTVFFTSDEQVTPDDADDSVDLYMWEEAGAGTLTRISTGELGDSGDTDECSVGWVSGCGVQTIDATIDRFEAGEEQIYTPDNWISENGEIYFYSPEQLDGGKGLVRGRNLYVYRDGAPRHVATLSAGTPAVRMQVAPDGAHMAFVTGEQITGYENQGSEQMYVYEPADDRMTCVSCHPTGEPPSGDAIAASNGLFMSDDGRAFFSTKSALVPFDTNNRIDVYEYVDGRAQLISSGVSGVDTWGGGLLIYPAMTVGLEGVSADGTDVYFSTFDTLVPEDENGEFIKFYNARTGGGFLFQAPPPPCKAADECHGGSSVGPPSPRVGTSASLGKTGNVRSQKKKKKKCKKGFAKRGGKCVKKKGAKKKRKRKSAGKRSRANG